MFPLKIKWYCAMKSRLPIATLLLCLCVPLTAPAGFWTGTVLINKLARCDNFTGVSATECSEGMGYVKGVADTLGVQAAKAVCDHTVKYSRLEQTVISWLRANQPRWEEPAEVLVQAAIEAEWPCPTETNSN